MAVTLTKKLWSASADSGVIDGNVETSDVPCPYPWILAATSDEAAILTLLLTPDPLETQNSYQVPGTSLPTGNTSFIVDTATDDTTKRVPDWATVSVALTDVSTIVRLNPV